jgi:glyoxylase-like metal-dependent hydrolase (beta-lactamase superfamily II)
LSAIPPDLAALGVQCVAGLATHEHYDHVLWHPGLGQVPRWASQRTAERLDTDREAILKPAVEFLTPDLLAVAGRLVALPSSILPWSGPSARVVEHDAHAPGHVALILTGRRCWCAGTCSATSSCDAGRQRSEPGHLPRRP